MATGEAAFLAQLALPDPDSDPPDGVLGAPGGTAPYGALSATRSYVRSQDAARCFRLALDHDGTGFEVFNVSAIDSIGRVDTLARLSAVYGRLPELRDPVHYDRDPHASVLDISRARNRLGWAPEGDWTSIVAQHPGAA